MREFDNNKIYKKSRSLSQYTPTSTTTKFVMKERKIILKIVWFFLLRREQIDSHNRRIQVQGRTTVKSSLHKNIANVFLILFFQQLFLIICLHFKLFLEWKSAVFAFRINFSVPKRNVSWENFYPYFANIRAKHRR